ncbi:hypothetical protein [Alkaliphilus hydrothermalis]|uniref:Cellulose biosynthesis protein BcsQ n=1 Tax=Alkaliphilus hydrothermalis TaxID=1482730 RepID=A0ABS2NTJ2_9FIRM|nr:hypothetical protein [Alkaliphilus hydrothermalis]MBM7616246.1 cellulose biosynthesis protein BcsQ [Alkaliphilus hydrothermalis]
MDVNTIGQKDCLESCVITTGVSSLNYYNEQLHSFGNSLVYNYMGVGSIENIAKVPHYKIIIDFSDNNIKEIIFELLNYLLSLNVEIDIKLIYNENLSSKNIDDSMTLLNRLEKHNLIDLEIIYRSSELPKEKECSSWLQKIKNTFFFTGAGNTGKTSLISALGEFCKDKGHAVALIDLSDNNKLINYFSNIYPLENINLQGNALKEKMKRTKEAVVDVYTYRFTSIKNISEEKDFYQYIKRISDMYDYVLLNADCNTVYDQSEIFNIAEKVFVVHDFMPTKINSSKQILLRLEEAGINSKGNISLVYNKIIKCYFDINFIEEKIIFDRTDNKSLVPIVDLDCHTFEIPYSRKTMKAMINHISHKASIINHVSFSYRRNIESIYKYINNQPYVEIDDVDVLEYGINYCKVTLSNILQHSYIQTFKEEIYKCKAYVKNRKRVASYLIHSRILEKH